MYHVILTLHAYFRYILLILFVWVVLKSLISWVQNHSFSKLDEKLSFWFTIAAHIQLVGGLILYFISPFVRFSGETMKNESLRYWTVEHISMMLLAVVLITVSRVRVKRLSQERKKFRSLFIYNSIALLMVIVSLLLSGRGVL